MKRAYPTRKLHPFRYLLAVELAALAALLLMAALARPTPEAATRLLGALPLSLISLVTAGAAAYALALVIQRITAPPLIVLAGAVLTVSPVGVALIAELLLDARLGLLPPGGVLRAVLAGVILALLPGFIAGRTTAPPLALSRMAGWVLLGQIAVEPLLGIDGVGAAVAGAYRYGDSVILSSAIPITVVVLALLRAPAHLVDMAAAPTPTPEPGRLSILMAGVVLVGALLVTAYSAFPPQTTPDPTRAHAQRSAGVPLGTDALGRDVRAPLLESHRTLLTVALTAGAIGVGGGAVWARVSPPRSRAPFVIAEAIILLGPILMLLAVGMAARSALLAGVMLGVLLAARAAPLLESAPTRESLVVGGLAVAFAAHHVVVLLLLSGVGDVWLAAVGEWPLIAPLVGDSRFLWQALALTGVLGLTSAALYASRIALGHADSDAWLPRLFS